jgi:hypothetical protein
MKPLVEWEIPSLVPGGILGAYFRVWSMEVLSECMKSLYEATQYSGRSLRQEHQQNWVLQLEVTVEKSDPPLEINFIFCLYL